jgi:hypothetical protein
MNEASDPPDHDGKSMRSAKLMELVDSRGRPLQKGDLVLLGFDQSFERQINDREVRYSLVLGVYREIFSSFNFDTYKTKKRIRFDECVYLRSLINDGESEDKIEVCRPRDFSLTSVAEKAYGKDDVVSWLRNWQFDFFAEKVSSLDRPYDLKSLLNGKDIQMSLSF